MARLTIIKIMSSETHDIDSLSGFLQDRGYLAGSKMAIPALVKINGERVLFKHWMNHECCNDDVIEYQLLAGDPGTSAAIASSIAAFFQAAAALYETSAFFAAAVNAVASLAVNKIISHFSKAPASATDGKSVEADSVYSFSGGQNAIATGQAKALLHGERNGFFPEIPHQDLVYITYEDGVDVEGNILRKRSNQMLSMLLYIGTGDCGVSNVTVEDTKFSALVNSEFEVIPPNGDISDFPRLVAVKELADAELLAWNEDGGAAVYGANEGWIGKDDGIVVNPWGVEIDGIYASFEFTLAKADNSNPSLLHPLTATADLQYVEVDKDGNHLGVWDDITSITSVINYFNGARYLALNEWVDLLGYNTSVHKAHVTFIHDVFNENSGNDSVTSGYLVLDPSDFEVDSTDPFLDRFRVTSLASLPASARYINITIRNYNYVVDNPNSIGVTHTGADLTPYVREIFFPLVKGRYAIRARRSNEKDLEVTARDQVRLIGAKGRNVRSYDNSNCTLLRVKLQASKQLSSQVSNQIKVDAFYKNDVGGIENRAGELIRRLIDGADGVYDDEGINANYTGLDAFQAKLDLQNSHVNCRITTQQTIGKLMDDLLSEIRSVKCVKSARLEFVRDAYPTIPEAIFTADKVVAGSLSEVLNLANDNKAGVIIGHYWDNNERRARRIKLKPSGSKSDIETEVQFKFINDINTVIKELYYLAQSNLLRVIPNTVTVGEEGLDLMPGAHINIALPRISDTQSVQIDDYNAVGKLVCLNVAPAVDDSKSYSIVFLDHFNVPSDPIEITGFDGRYLTIVSDPLVVLRLNVSEGNRTRAIIHEIGYQMERRLVEDIQVSNSDNKILCELRTVDDYPEVHEGSAQVWIDDAIASRGVTVTAALGEVFFDDWADNLTLVLNGGNLTVSWDDYPLASDNSLLISGYEIVVTTLSAEADPVSGYYFTDQDSEVSSAINSAVFIVPITDEIISYGVIVKPIVLDAGVDGGFATDSLDNPNYVEVVPWVPNLGASYIVNGDLTKNVTVTYNPHPFYDTDFRLVEYDDGTNFSYPLDGFATPPYNNLSAETISVYIEYVRITSYTPFSYLVLDSVVLNTP